MTAPAGFTVTRRGSLVSYWCCGCDEYRTSRFGPVLTLWALGHDCRGA